MALALKKLKDNIVKPFALAAAMSLTTLPAAANDIPHQPLKVAYSAANSIQYGDNSGINSTLAGRAALEENVLGVMMGFGDKVPRDVVDTIAKSIVNRFYEDYGIPTRVFVDTTLDGQGATMGYYVKVKDSDGNPALKHFGFYGLAEGKADVKNVADVYNSQNSILLSQNSNVPLGPLASR